MMRVIRGGQYHKLSKNLKEIQDLEGLPDFKMNQYSKLLTKKREDSVEKLLRDAGTMSPRLPSIQYAK